MVCDCDERDRVADGLGEACDRQSVQVLRAGQRARLADSLTVADTSPGGALNRARQSTGSAA